MVAVAIAARDAMYLYGFKNTFLPLLPAVLLAAICFGFWAGLLAIALCIAGAAVWPDLPYRFSRLPTDMAAYSLFTAVSLGVSWLAPRWRQARQQARSDGELRRLLDRQVVDVLEGMSDAFYMLDSEWRYTYVNRQCEIYYGRKRDELIGRVIWDVFPKAVGTIFDERFHQVLEQRSAAHFEGFRSEEHT